jgi:regulatory protein
MPTVTQVSEQKRRKNRHNVYLDGVFAFGCNVNVVAKFHLREGLVLSAADLEAILNGSLRQECFDKGIKTIERRLHSREEVRKKHAKFEYPPSMIESVLDDIERLGYINDAKFAASKAESAAKHRHHGRRRAAVELVKKGVTGDTLRRALDDVYDTHDSLGVAKELVRKQMPRLSRLDPLVARRRLTGMLMRRGFEYDVVRPVIDDALGHHDEPVE